MNRGYREYNRKELEEELGKCQEIVDMLSRTVLGGTARLSLDNLDILSASEGYYRMTGYTKEESLLPPFLGCGANLVLPEDREVVGQVLKQLNEGKSIDSVDYRIRKKDGTIAWNTAFCSRVQEGEQGRYVEVFFLDCTERKNTELQLTSLLNNMTSGLIRIRVDGGIRVVYANDEFYRQIGYSPSEFAAFPLENDYLKLIHESEREALYQKLKKFLYEKKKCPSTELQIVDGKGEVHWIRAYASRLYEELQDDENLIQCILTDITFEKVQSKQNMLNEERFRIISEQTKEVIFDWDISTDSIHYSPVFEKMFGFPPPESISTKTLLEGNLFYEEDKQVIEKMIADMSAASPYVECRARMKGRDGNYFWTQHRATTIYDENRRSLLIVGVVSDVNDFMENTFELQHKAEHDQLTGLLNRQAAQELIGQILRNNSVDGTHVFVQFDIDRFKQINDFMGHAAGDLALQTISRKMQEVFRAEDILFRMGGDEFAIFMINSASGDAIEKRLTKFLQVIAGDFEFDGKNCPLSVSIGVAFYPKDGRDFQLLYKHADKALYQAKRAGGNCMKVYRGGSKKSRD